jgi:hypothetical protein
MLSFNNTGYAVDHLATKVPPAAETSLTASRGLLSGPYGDVYVVASLGVVGAT